MTAEEYGIWSKHHATLFAMHKPTDADLFAAWMPLILPYNLEDFIAGSNFLAQERGSAYRSEHLTLIRGRINERRLAANAARYAAESQQAGEDECRLCRGTGIIIVPHLAYVRHGEWLPPFPLAGIFCGICNFGRSRYDAVWGDAERQKRGKPKPLEWRKYEALVPDWQVMLERREKMVIEESKARQISIYADRTDPLKSVAAGMRLPAPDPKTRGNFKVEGNQIVRT